MTRTSHDTSTPLLCRSIKYLKKPDCGIDVKRQTWKIGLPGEHGDIGNVRDGDRGLLQASTRQERELDDISHQDNHGICM